MCAERGQELLFSYPPGIEGHEDAPGECIRVDVQDSRATKETGRRGGGQSFAWLDAEAQASGESVDDANH